MTALEDFMRSARLQVTEILARVSGDSLILGRLIEQGPGYENKTLASLRGALSALEQARDKLSKAVDDLDKEV